MKGMRDNIFWDIALCSPLKVNRRFGGTYIIRTLQHSEQLIAFVNAVLTTVEPHYNGLVGAKGCPF
jgi:hypothetical protein